MCRPLLWSLMIVATGLVLSSPASAAEPGPPAVEEWQVRGILAALKDGYKEVRVLAAKEGLDFPTNGERSEKSVNSS
jgi:hypothetical protein